MIDQIIIDSLITGFIVLAITSCWKKLFPKRHSIWIIEDSETDRMLMRVNLKLDNCDVRYLNNADNIKGEYINSLLPNRTKPSAIIVDYYLNSEFDGDQVLNFCKLNEIPAILVTSYEGDISGIDRKQILVKSTNKQFYRDLEKWVYATV